MSRQMSLLSFRRRSRMDSAVLEDDGFSALEAPTRRLGRDQLKPWSRLTVAEFIERADHQFGSGADSMSLLLAGYRRSDRLTEADVRLLCDRLGLPATDFGVDP